MDKAARDNRTDQCNPTDGKTGPGHDAGYKGTGTKADLDNHGNQLNPNNPRYQGGLDNHANQLNPNNPLYQGGNK